MIRLDFEAVHASAGVIDLIEPLRRAFAQDVTAPPRNHYELGTPPSTDSLLVMPCWREAGQLGVKIVTVFPSNEQRGLSSINGEYLLLSRETGEPLALIDRRALTLLRTAAVSALAADLLAAPHADSLLMMAPAPRALFHQGSSRGQALQVGRGLGPQRGRRPSAGGPAPSKTTYRYCLVTDLEAGGTRSRCHLLRYHGDLTPRQGRRGYKERAHLQPRGRLSPLHGGGRH